MGAAGILADDVREGQELAPLAVDVTATTVVLGAIASRDWRPMHHDKDFAVHRNGTRDIFLNTPNQAAWFERYLTDWTGPLGRLGRMQFRMRDSVFPGDTMVFRGTVEKVSRDETGCAWVDVALRLSVDERLATECRARIAVPAHEGDNPWKRKEERWRP
jgi:acyl dehydratase